MVGAEVNNPLMDTLRLVLEPGVSKVIKKEVVLGPSWLLVADRRNPFMEGSVFSKTIEKEPEPLRGKAGAGSLEESDIGRGIETDEEAHKRIPVTELKRSEHPPRAYL
jgi:hypothetical protein